MNDLLAPVVVYLGQFEEAEKLARQAIEHDPLAYQARQSLARLLFVQGKLNDAEAAARKAAELQPTAAGMPSLAGICGDPAWRWRSGPA